MGKSTFMKHVAITWTDETVEELNKFRFAFHVALKHVKDNSPIENVIISQHNGLETNKVQPAEIKSILEGDNKVLLLIDGHDEYKQDMNSDTDTAIEKKSLWNCWMVLSSRRTDVKDYMDTEIDILGFQGNDVIKYINQSLGNEQKMRQLLEEVASRGLGFSDGQGQFNFNSSLLRIPFLLNMVCVLFLSNMALLKTMIGVIDSMVNRCMDRESIRAKGQKAVDGARSALYTLGKLVWEELVQGNFVFEEVNKIFDFHVVTYIYNV